MVKKILHNPHCNSASFFFPRPSYRQILKSDHTTQYLIESLGNQIVLAKILIIHSGLQVNEGDLKTTSSSHL